MMTLHCKSWAGAALAVLAFGAATRAETKLALKFQPGEVVRQEMLESVRIEVTPPGEKKASATVIDQRWFLDSKTEKADDSAGGTLRQKFTRISVSLQLPPPVSRRFTVDTDRPEESEEKLENDMREGVAKVIGLEWMLTFEPSGAISNVELSDELAETLINNPQVGPLTDTFSDAGLRKLSEQTSVTFPAQRVKKGDTWEQTVTRAFPEGKLQTKRICTYLGTVEDGLEKIGVKMQASYQAAKGAKQPMELTENAGEGEVLFDPRAGRVVRSKLTQLLIFKMGLPERQGMQRIVMVNTLLPADERQRPEKPEKNAVKTEKK